MTKKDQKVAGAYWREAAYDAGVILAAYSTSYAFGQLIAGDLQSQVVLEGDWMTSSSYLVVSSTYDAVQFTSRQSIRWLLPLGLLSMWSFRTSVGRLACGALLLFGVWSSVFLNADEIRTCQDWLAAWTVGHPDSPAPECPVALRSEEF